MGCFMGLFIGDSFSCGKWPGWRCLEEQMGVGEAWNLCGDGTKHRKHPKRGCVRAGLAVVGRDKQTRPPWGIAASSPCDFGES